MSIVTGLSRAICSLRHVTQLAWEQGENFPLCAFESHSKTLKRPTRYDRIPVGRSSERRGRKALLLFYIISGRNASPCVFQFALIGAIRSVAVLAVKDSYDNCTTVACCA